MVKRATHTFESEKDGLQSDSLSLCYCLCCGETILILGSKKTLETLPHRRTDGALVLARSETTFKLKAKPGKHLAIKREGGYEPQWRYNCTKCGVPVAYRCVEDEQPELTYMMKDAVGGQADMYLQLHQVPNRTRYLRMHVHPAPPVRTATRAPTARIAPSARAVAGARMHSERQVVRAADRPRGQVRRA